MGGNPFCIHCTQYFCVNLGWIVYFWSITIHSIFWCIVSCLVHLFIYISTKWMFINVNGQFYGCVKQDFFLMDSCYSTFSFDNCCMTWIFPNWDPFLLCTTWYRGGKRSQIIGSAKLCHQTGGGREKPHWTFVEYLLCAKHYAKCCDAKMRGRLIQQLLYSYSQYFPSIIWIFKNM